MTAAVEHDQVLTHRRRRCSPRWSTASAGLLQPVGRRRARRSRTPIVAWVDLHGAVGRPRRAADAPTADRATTSPARCSAWAPTRPCRPSRPRRRVRRGGQRRRRQRQGARCPTHGSARPAAGGRTRARRPARRPAARAARWPGAAARSSSPCGRSRRPRRPTHDRQEGGSHDPSPRRRRQPRDAADRHPHPAPGRLRLGRPRGGRRRRGARGGPRRRARRGPVGLEHAGDDRHRAACGALRAEGFDDAVRVRHLRGLAGDARSRPRRPARCSSSPSRSRPDAFRDVIDPVLA